MRDNAGENKSQEIVDFFKSMGIKSYHSTAHEQWQNGLPESAINSIMMISKLSCWNPEWAVDSDSNLQ
jgi:hypothetical protein